MLLCTAREAFVKQTAFNNISHTEVSSKLFYSLTRVFFSHKFSRQSAKAALHFHLRMLGIHPLSNQRERLFLVVYEAYTVVSQLLNACKTRMECNSQSLRRPIFQTTEKKPPQSKVYQCVS